MYLFGIGEKNNVRPEFYIMVEVIDMPPMVPGYPSDGPMIRMFRIDTDDLSIRGMTLKEFKANYKFVVGKKERMEYWSIIREMERERF